MGSLLLRVRQHFAKDVADRIVDDPPCIGQEGRIRARRISLGGPQQCNGSLLCEIIRIHPQTRIVPGISQRDAADEWIVGKVQLFSRLPVARLKGKAQCFVGFAGFLHCLLPD